MDKGYQMSADNPKTVAARAIAPGQCFRKKTGEYVYLRISESAARFLGLDTSNVHGVCYNGNMCMVKSDVRVVRKEIKDMLGNVDKEKDWGNQIGVKNYIWYVEDTTRKHMFTTLRLIRVVKSKVTAEDYSKLHLDLEESEVVASNDNLD